MSSMDGQVLQCLEATLSPHKELRRNAEEQLKQLYLHPEGGLSLARILLAPGAQSAQRQSAGILLQQYIFQHWSAASDNFQDPLTPVEIKGQIRPIIFHGLSDEESKIRSASAFALSSIARYDWPDEYPDLLSSLISLLKSGSNTSVHGAMRVIAEFVKNDLSEDQLLPVVNELVPALLTVLVNTQVCVLLPNMQLTGAGSFCCYSRINSQRMPASHSDAGNGPRGTSSSCPTSSE